MANYLSDNCYCNGDLYTVNLESTTISADVIRASRINADELHYETMSFDTISAETGIINNLTSDVINCDEIHYGTMTFDELNATTANINNLNSNEGEITTLTTTNLTTSDLTGETITGTNIEGSSVVVGENSITSEGVSAVGLTTEGTVNCDKVRAITSITSPSLNGNDATILNTISVSNGITLHNQSISEWADLNQYITPQPTPTPTPTSSSIAITKDGILGNDIIESINNNSIIYSNYNRVLSDNKAVSSSESKVKWISDGVFENGKRSAEGEDVYINVGPSLLPFCSGYYSGNHQLNQIISSSSKILNNSSQNNMDGLFGDTYVGLYTFNEKKPYFSIPSNTSRSSATPSSYGPLLASIRDRALVVGSSNVYVEYVVLFYMNHAIYTYYDNANNRFVDWMNLFEGSVGVNHWMYSCRWHDETRLDTCGSWLALVRNDNLESTTNGFYFYMCNAEMNLNMVSGQYQLKLYKRTITAANLCGDTGNYYMWLSRGAVAMYRECVKKIFIFAYLDENSTSSIKRMCGGASVNDLIGNNTFVYDEWMSCYDPLLNGLLNRKSRLRVCNWDNGSVLLGDYMGNTNDIMFIPTANTQYGRYNETAYQTGVKGCLIGTVSFNPFIPNNPASSDMNKYYYYITYDASDAAQSGHKYHFYVCREVQSSIPYSVFVSNVDNQIDLSFTEFSDVDDYWYLYAINWSVQTPFAVYRNTLVNDEYSDDDRYILVRLKLKTYDFDKICFVNNGDIMPIN